MKRVLIPTDFSPQAHNAFLFALQLAAQVEAEIVLFHAYHYDAVGGQFLTPEIIQLVNSHRKEEALQAMQAYVEKARSEMKTPPAFRLELREGSVIKEMQAFIKEEQIDFVVMGTKGAGNQPDALVGSITAEAIEKVSVPVWAIPESAIFRPIEHIAYATNFEEQSLSLPKDLIALAKFFEARISCVHISKSNEGGWDQLMMFIREEVMRLDLDHDHMELLMLSDDNIYEGLEKFVQENEVDVMAMLTHRHNLLESLFKKSITRQAVLHSHIPILAYHA